MKGTLDRSIGRWDLAAVTINAVVGAGIFGLPSKTYQLAGPWSLLAFAACAVLVAAIALCFAEVGSRFSATGGPYVYAREAFGPLAGFEVGWLTWLARVTAFAANCNLLVDYTGFFWPAVAAGAGRAVFLTLTVASLMSLNIRGVRKAALASNIATVGKLAALGVFIAAGLFFIDPALFRAERPPQIASISSAMLLLLYAFTGFEMATIPSGEVRDPRRDLPVALLSAIAVIAVFYVLIQFVSIGTLPGLGLSERPLADAAQRFLGRAGGGLIAVGVVVSLAGNLNILVLSASRLPFAMAEQGDLPAWLAAVHPRFRTPHRAILVTAVCMLAVTVSGTFLYAVAVSAVVRLFLYGAVCLTLPVFRHRPAAPPAAFLAPAGPVLAGLAVATAGWLLFQSSWQAARDASIAAAAGLAIYLGRRL